MLKHAAIPVLCVFLLGSLPLFGGKGVSSSGADALQEAIQPPGETSGDISRLGIRLAPVPPELAAHLGLEGRGGVMVTDVQEDSPAAAAGIEAFDVILAVQGVAATTRAIEEALRESRGIELDLVRAGLVHHVAIPGASGQEEAGFLSSNALPVDHPFRRLTALAALRRSYAEKADAWSHRVRELDDQARRTRQEAEKEKKALRERAEAQVAEHLRSIEERLLQVVDSRLAPARVEPLRALGLELSSLVPDERVQAVEKRIAAIAALLRGSVPETIEPGLAGLPEQVARAIRQRFAQLGQEVTNRLGERIGRRWTSSLREIAQHRDRLGRFPRRLEAASKAVQEIRRELGERVTCAIKRTREEFSKELHHRLDKMELPGPGEVEACIEDVRDQIDAMAERLLSRTERALDRFSEQVGGANPRLVHSSEAHLAGIEEALSALEKGLGPILAAHRPAGVDAASPSWWVASELARLHHSLRDQLWRAIDQGRDGARSELVPLTVTFREHEVVCEDAWRDLEQLLNEIRQQAANTCWKLDGPHLDGRFPGKEPPRGKTEIAAVVR